MTQNPPILEKETLSRIKSTLARQQYCIFHHIYTSPLTTSDDIIYAVWIGRNKEEPEAGAQTIRTQLWRLRKKLREHGLTVVTASTGGGKGNFSKYIIQSI